MAQEREREHGTPEERELFERSENEHAHVYHGGDAKAARECIGSKADPFYGDKAARVAHEERAAAERDGVDRRSDAPVKRAATAPRRGNLVHPES